MPGTSASTSAASTSQVPPIPLPDSSESSKCPICWETISDEACVSWCRHSFCFPCIRKWACQKTVCPLCRASFQHIFRRVGVNDYEVHRVVPCENRRRSRGRPAERRQHHSSGRRHRSSSSSSDHSSGQAGAPERGQRRSPRRHQDGHSRAQQAQGYSSSRSRRQQRSRARDSGLDES